MISSDFGVRGRGENITRIAIKPYILIINLAGFKFAPPELQYNRVPKLV